jgi:hypothetical protein
MLAIVYNETILIPKMPNRTYYIRKEDDEKERSLKGDMQDLISRMINEEYERRHPENIKMVSMDELVQVGIMNGVELYARTLK